MSEQRTMKGYANDVVSKAVDQYNNDERYNILLRRFIELRIAALGVVRATGPDQTYRAIQVLKEQIVKTPNKEIKT